MSDEDEGRALKEQLQFQLNEQKESLAAVADALSADPSNHELLSVNVELVQSIKDAEEGLFHLKKARLPREADSVLDGSVSLDVRVRPLGPLNAEAESLVDQRFSVGSKCRFRYANGHWYNGLIVRLEASESAKIYFLTPTSDSMLVLNYAIKAVEEEEESEDVFTFINNQLANKKRQQSKVNVETKIADRRSLLAYEDEMKNLRGRNCHIRFFLHSNALHFVYRTIHFLKISFSIHSWHHQ